MRAWLTFNAKLANKGVLYDVAKNYDAHINILRADISSHGGKMLLEINGAQEEEFIQKIGEAGINISSVRRVLKKDDDKCVDCGGCLTLCPVDAISFSDEWEILVDEKTCIACGACAKSCPAKALRIIE